jgi:probable rRNA maturation factor
MPEYFPVQVEVNVQDYFFEDLPSDDEVDSKGESSLQETISIGPKSSEEAEDTATSCPVSTSTWNDWFSRWLEHLPDDRPPAQAYELSLRLTDDQGIRSLNAQYRQQDRATDVLAFAALEADYPLPEELEAIAPLYLGDIVISVETAQRQAQEREHPLEQELAWLSAHALLHLLGWDHPDEESLGCMLSQQKELLQTIGFTTQYDDEEKDLIGME